MSAEEIEPEGVRRLPLPEQRPEETLLYAALRARQDQMDRLDNFTIFVQPWIAIRRQKWFRPDFVVVMRSALAVEIDGSSHRGRYCSDRSRDELLGDHNLTVLRIPIEDTEMTDLVEDWVERILSRCRGFRWNGAA